MGMDPSRARRLALSLTWTPRSGPRRRWGLAFDPLPWLLPLAVTAAILLAAFGTRFLPPSAFVPPAAQSSAPAPDSQAPKAAMASLPAPGHPHGEKSGGDIITPLNVRDPASLVMGPSGYNPPASVIPDVKPPEPMPPAKKRSKKMKSEDWRKQENYRF